MENNFSGLVKQVIDRYGVALLDDRPRCEALLADYAKGKYMPQIRLFMVTLEAGFHTEIAQASDPAGVKERLAGALEHRYLIAPQAAEDMILLLGTLFHKPMTPRSPPPVQQAPQTPPPRPAPRPAPSPAPAAIPDGLEWKVEGSGVTITNYSGSAATVFIPNRI